MLEQCDFMELTEEVLQQCKGFTCKDEDITEFFTQDYADYAYQLLGKSYCFVKPDTSEIVCAFTVANSSVKVDSLPSNLRNKLNRKIPNAKRRPQYPAVLVGQLAVSDLFSGHHVGDELLDFIKSWFIDPLNKTGCRYVIVDAVNHVDSTVVLHCLNISNVTDGDALASHTTTNQEYIGRVQTLV